MDIERICKIRQAVRDTIIYYLKEDLRGNEYLMKNVWEECRNEDDDEAARKEMKQIIKYLENKSSEL